ncbi:MAG: hypothetical protein MK041_07925 [Aquabacterium sp.]|nr:hypothetical protein [Aquabacterium sp.]
MGWLDPSSLLHRLTHAAADVVQAGPAGGAQPCACEPGRNEARADGATDAPATETPSFVADLLNWQQAHARVERSVRPAAGKPGSRQD